MEPFIEYGVELCGESPSCWIENEWNVACMSHGVSHVLVSSRAGFPTSDLASIAEAFVQDIRGASPHMEVVEM